MHGWGHLGRLDLKPNTHYIPNVFEGQCHRSKVKVIKVKCQISSFQYIIRKCGQGHKGQGQAHKGQGQNAKFVFSTYF